MHIDTSVKALFRLALPILIANLAIIGSGTIDTIMAGHLGKEHLASVALSMAATMSVMLGCTGILQGVSPIAGHHFGAKRYREIGHEFSQNILIGFVLCFFAVPLLLYTDLWTSLGQVEGEIATMTAQNLAWTALALPAMFLSRTIISINAAVNRPMVTMWVSLITLGLKVPLNLIFMYGYLGFPAMGGGGAGLSFFVDSLLALFAYLYIWQTSHYYDKMRLPRFFQRPNCKLLKEQLRIGIPMGLSTFFEVSSFTLMAIFVSRLGAEMMSAHQIVSNITTLCYMLPLSIGITTSVMVAQTLGKGDPVLARYVLLRSIRIGTLLAVLLCLCLYLLRTTVLSLYTSEVTVQSLGAQLLLFGCFYHVFDALQTISSFGLRAYRVTFLPMLIFGFMLWCVGLGGGYYLAFSSTPWSAPLGIYGFWGATATGLFLTGLSLLAIALYVTHNRAKNH